jgi:hypothetical protein
MATNVEVAQSSASGIVVVLPQDGAIGNHGPYDGIEKVKETIAGLHGGRIVRDSVLSTMGVDLHGLLGMLLYVCVEYMDGRQLL